MSAEVTARRYVAWIARRARAILVVAGLVLAAATYLVAARLPLFADLAYLLPADAQSVVDLHKLEARLAANDTVLVVIDAPDPARRARATAALARAIRALPPELVTRVDEDQAEARAFLWEHRFLLAPLAEVQRARDALKHRIDAAKLAANPLYIDLDADDPQRAEADRTAKQQIADLRARRRDLDAALHRPSNVSADGRRALIEVRAAMSATDVERGTRLLDALAAARAPVEAAEPGVHVGFAGDLVTSIAEHDAIASGTLISTIVTTVLVGLVLALYFRSARLLALLVVTIALATVVAFATAVFSIGHLNAATAFLGAIIAGNGINYGILLIARYLEERGAHGVEDALARAIAHTLRPTAIASLGAAIAYGSLAATSFKGFADFAIIGSAGMVLCWLATYVVLPALVVLFARSARAVTSARTLERVLVRVLGVRRPRAVVIGGALLAAAAAAVVVVYLAHDPFEYDLRELGSVADASETERQWMKLAEQSFGKGRAGRTFLAVDREDDVPAAVAALAARRDAIGSVQSILDVVPAEQDRRRALLREIHDLLDDDALDELAPDERAELRELRPPADVAPVTRAMLPRAIVELLAEKDGRLGLLISARPADGLDELDGHDVIKFADAIRAVELPAAGGLPARTITTSGASVIFADILGTIAADGPRVTLLAIGGLAIMLLGLLGPSRRALAVFVATTGGALFLVAICAALGTKVTFLDFVALPITLGLGVDYGINVAHRQLAGDDPIAALRTSGAAVFVCSLTTMIGYGSLLASSNLAIRGFGRASLIGEITTVLTALVLVPAVLAWRRGSRS